MKLINTCSYVSNECLVPFFDLWIGQLFTQCPTGNREDRGSSPLSLQFRSPHFLSVHSAIDSGGCM